MLLQVFLYSALVTAKPLAKAPTPIDDPVESALRELVQIPSHYENLSGLTATAKVIQNQFQEVGVSLEWDPESKALFGRWVIDAKAPTILLVGHLDTVFHKEDFAHELKPLTLEKNDRRRIFAPAFTGPGSADAKGGIIFAREFLRNLIITPLEAPINLAFFFSADEEIGSRSSKVRLEAFVKQTSPDLAFVLEPGWWEDGKLIIPISTSGLYRTEILITRPSEHSGTSKKLGVSAFDGIAKVHEHFAKLRRPGVSVHAYSVSGESAPNVTMNSATIRYDIRYTDFDFGIKIKALLKRLEKEFSKSEMTLRFESSKTIREPAKLMPPGLFGLLQQTAAALKLPRVESRASMARGAEGFLVKLNVPTVPAFGPIGFDFHSPKEWVLLGSLEMRDKWARKIISRFLLSRKPSRSK